MGGRRGGVGRSRGETVSLSRGGARAGGKEEEEEKEEEEKKEEEESKRHCLHCFVRP